MSALTKLKHLFDGESHPALTDWAAFAKNDTAPDWVKALRQRASDKVAATDLPTAKWERYKYTPVAQLVKHLSLSFDQADVSWTGAPEFMQAIPDALQNAPAWLRTMAEQVPAGEKQYRDMVLWDAANAYLRDGIALDVPANTTGHAPLHITMTGHDGVYFVPRTFLRIGAGADFTIIENHTGNGTYWNNRITQIHVEKGARLRHYRIQDNSFDAVYTQNTHVVLERDAIYEAFVLTTGAAFSRNQIHVDLAGENAEARLAGVNLLSGTQLGDTTITIEHQAPHCRSNQTYKTILDDKARGVFQGKVHVHQIAQRTDGYQLANTLLLSPTAEMDTKPELEIYADDVKCSHGATTGQMDNGPLFYLRSRGLSEAQAKMLLMQAFLGPALDEIRDDAAREMISAQAFACLEQKAAK